MRFSAISQILDVRQLEARKPQNLDDVLVFVCLQLRWQDIYHLG